MRYNEKLLSKLVQIYNSISYHSSRWFRAVKLLDIQSMVQNVVHSYTIESVESMTTNYRAKSPGVRLYGESVERDIT